VAIRPLDAVRITRYPPSGSADRFPQSEAREEGPSWVSTVKRRVDWPILFFEREISLDVLVWFGAARDRATARSLP